MRLLLDTHVFLWAVADPDRLGRLRPLLEDPGTEIILSVASAWEVAIKAGSGRLQLPEPARTYVPERVLRIGGRLLPVSAAHALGVELLPPHHRDPFDRLLVATALDLEIPLASADRQLEAYPVDLRRP